MKTLLLTLKVGFRDFSVFKVSDTDPDLLGCDGLCLNDRSWPCIYLSDKLAPAAQAEVLIHELMHAYWDAFNLPGRVDEEGACKFFGVAMSTLIRDNPTLSGMLGLAIHRNEGIF